jgi:predicted transcriptional regulator
MKDLSRRERQIMDLLFERGRATAAEVQESIPDPPSNSATRMMLRRLEEKGHVRHREEGLRFVYEPTEAREPASRSALKHLLKTFFGGSTEQAMLALLDETPSSQRHVQLDRLAAMIEKAKEEGR